MKKNFKKKATNRQKLNLKLSIVEYIKHKKKLPNKFGSRTRLDYYLKPLKIHNVVYKKGYGVWDVDWDNWLIYYNKQLQKNNAKIDKKVQKITKGTIPLVRGHGFQFYLDIPKRILWDKKSRSNFVDRLNLSNSKNDDGIFKVRVYGHKVWVCDGGIIVYFPEGMDFRGDSAKDTQLQAVYEFKRVISRLCRLSGYDLSDKGKLRFSIDKQHYADVEHELAKEYNNKKEKFKVVGPDGKVWLLVDFSHKQNEFEYVHPKDSQVDRDECINPFFNDLRANYKKTNEAILPTDLLTMIHGLAKNQQFIMEQLSPASTEIQSKDKLKESGLIDRPHYIG